MKYYLHLIFMFSLLLGISNLNATTYTSTATANWSAEVWSPAGTPGASDSVIIASSHNVTLNANVTLASLVINSGGTLTMSTASVTLTSPVSLSGTMTVSAAATVAGDLTISGSGAFTANVTGTVTMSGNITCTGPTASFKTNSGSTLIAGTAGKTFTLSNGATFQSSYNTSPLGVISNVTWVIDNSVALTTIVLKNSGNTSIINPPNGQVIGNLQFSCASGSANKVFALGANLNILGDLTFNDLNTGAGFTRWDFGAYNVTTTGTGKGITVSQAASGTSLIIKGTGSSMFNGFSSANFIAPSNSNCTVIYSGASAQSIAGGAYQNLADSSAGTKTLAGSASVSGILTLASGNLSTSSYTLSVTSTGSVSRTAGHVIGNFKKYVATGATSKTFEIGEGSNYMPVTIAFGNVTVAGDLTVNTTASSHPNVGTSGINAAKSLSRYWTLANNGITFDNFSATFTFVAGDILGGASTSAFIGQAYNAGWSSVLSMGTKTSTTSQVTGVTSVGDFILGEAGVATPSIVLNGSLSSFGYVPVGSSSAEQSYTVSGSNLTAGITLTPPVGFQISKTSGSGFVSNPGTIVLSQSGGLVNATTIYVKFVPVSSTTYSANITHTSTGAVLQNEAVVGTSTLASEPTTVASAVLYSGYSSTSLTVNWTAGNGTNHIVIAKAASDVTSSPVDGTTYTANTAFGSGSQIGTGNYVVYNGTGSSVTITGLTTGTYYDVKVYEFNGPGGTENYLTSSYGTSYQIASGSVSAVASGNWSTGGTWSSNSAPTASTNVIIPNGFTVTCTNSTNNCFNLTVENGATLRSDGSNVTSAASRTLRVNGTKIMNYGIIGFGSATLDTSGLRFDIYNTGSTVTFSGTGKTMLTKLIPAAVVPELKISTNMSISYQANYGSAGGSGLQFVNSPGVFSILTLDATDTLSFSNSSNISSVSSASGDATLSYVFNINGVVTGPSTANFRPDASHTSTININSGGSFNINGSLSPTGAGLSTITVNGTLTLGTGTTDFSNASQYIAGTGTVVLPSGGNISIGALTGLNSSTGPIRTSTRTFDALANYTFNGVAAQVTGADLPSTVRNLTINNGSGVTLSNSTTVSNTLALSNGVLTVDSKILTLEGSISGTTNTNAKILTSGTGEVRKSITAVPTTFTFPVGTSGSYSPAKITLSSGTLSSAYIGVRVAATKSSNNSSSTDYINRTWTLTGNGITNPVHTDTLTYVAADIAGTETNLVGGLYNGSSWNSLGAVDATNNYIMGSGLTSFGDITAGEASAMGASSSGGVAVTVIPQGYYNAGDYLNSLDTVSVLLADASTYVTVDSTAIVLDSVTFASTATFSTAATGSYYLVVKQRASVETWSSSTIAFVRGSTVSYDFTDAQTKAYGDNQVQVNSSPVRWAIYGGDCNQDGYVDPLDMSLIDQDSFNYVSGSGLTTDVNGDHFVDPLDMSIADQNSFNYVGIKRPVTAKSIKTHSRAQQGIHYQDLLKLQKKSN